MAGAGAGGGDPLFGGGLGDLFDAFFGGKGSPFGGGQRGPAGPPRGQDLEVVVDLAFEEAVFGTTLPVTVRTAVPLRRLRGDGRRPGTHAVDAAPSAAASGQVRRVRQTLLGQMVTAGPCPRCGGRGPGHRGAVPDVPGRGPHDRGAHLHRRRPRRRRHRLHAAAHRARRGRAPRRARRRPLRPPPGAAPRPLRSATATTSSPSCRCRSPRPRSAPTSRSRRSTAPRTSPSPPGTQTGGCSGCGAGACPTSRGGAGATCGSCCVVDTPTELSADEQELLRQLAEERGEAVDPPATGLFSRIKSAFK